MLIYFTQDEFGDAIMWLKDTGILNKLKHDVMNPPFPIPDPSVRYKQPLILRQLGIVMIILVAGLTAALIVFAGEYWMGRKGGRASKQTESFPLKGRSVMHENYEDYFVPVA